MRTVFRISAYPKQLVLANGQEVTIRPLQVGDREDLREFFQGIPASDRFFLADDVTDPGLIDRWTSHLDYFRALPLVAIGDGKIVADGVLLRGRGPARAHTAEIRLLVAPRFRKAGLAGLLLEELCRIAEEARLDLVFLEVLPERDDDILRAARRLGFRKVASIPEGVRDATGAPKTILLLAQRFLRWPQSLARRPAVGRRPRRLKAGPT